MFILSICSTLSFRNTFFQTSSWTVRSYCYSAQILSVVPISLRVKARFLKGQGARQLILGHFVSPQNMHIIIFILLMNFNTVLLDFPISINYFVSKFLCTPYTHLPSLTGFCSRCLFKHKKIVIVFSLKSVSEPR